MVRKVATISRAFSQVGAKASDKPSDYEAFFSLDNNEDYAIGLQSLNEQPLKSSHTQKHTM